MAGRFAKKLAFTLLLVGVLASTSSLPAQAQCRPCNGGAYCCR